MRIKSWFLRYMVVKFQFLLYLLFLPFYGCVAQQYINPDQITGLWTGTLYNDSTQKFYKYEIGISNEKNKLSGFSHTYFLKDDKEYYGVKKLDIHINENGNLIITDNGLIANNYPEPPAKGVRQTNVLSLTIHDSLLVLEGPYSTNRTKKYNAITGTVRLTRNNDFWKSALIPHLQELGKSDALSFVKSDIETSVLKKRKEQIIEIKRKEIINPSNELNQSSPIYTQRTTPLQTTTLQAQPDVATIDTRLSTISKEGVAADSTGDRQTETVVLTEKVTSTKPLSREHSVAEKNTSTVSKNLKSNDDGSLVFEPLLVEEDQPLRLKGDSAIKQKAIRNTRSGVSAIEKIELAEPPAAHAFERVTILEQTIEVNSDSLSIALYDNGEVDGDIVSVLLNGSLWMAKEELSTTAIRKKIAFDQSDDEIELVMYAENLGRIPPNTGLLVVSDGTRIFEVRFSGDLQNNAAIRIRKKGSPR